MAEQDRGLSTYRAPAGGGSCHSAPVRTNSRPLPARHKEQGTLETLAVLLAFAGLLLVTACGEDVAGPDQVYAPAGCTEELASGCWTLLGLENENILTVVPTPWGVFAGTRSGRIHHLDLERRWREVGPAAWHDRLLVQVLHFVPTDPPRLLAGPHYRDGLPIDSIRAYQPEAVLFKSSDRGASWQPIDIGGDPSYVSSILSPRHLVADPADPRRLFLETTLPTGHSSHDAGETWSVVELLYSRSARMIFDLAGRIVRTSPLVVSWPPITEHYPEIAWSSDMGGTWTRITPQCNGQFLFAVSALGVVPGQPATWLVSGYESILLPANPGSVPIPHAGQTLFVRATANEPVESWGCSAVPHAIRGFASLQENVFGVVSDDAGRLGLYRTTDGGLTWTALATPNAQGAGTIVADAENGRLLIGTSAGLWALKP